MTIVAISGAAGTLGRHLIPMLLARGDRVRAIDVAPLDELDGVESRQVDIRVRDAVQGALEGTEALVHAAAWHGIHMRDHPPRVLGPQRDGHLQRVRGRARGGTRRVRAPDATRTPGRTMNVCSSPQRSSTGEPRLSRKRA